MLRAIVDNSNEIWGAKTSIADLAKFSFNDEDSREMTVEYAWSLIEKDWSFEVDHHKSELEVCVGIRAAFKDGSRLIVGAWAD